MNLMLKIKSEYPSMSKAARKVADYLMANPSGFLSLSAIDIGRQSEASSASVIRFSQQLGFRSLEELKISIATQLSELSEEHSELDRVIQRDDSPEQLARKLSQLVSDTMEMLMSRLDYKQLEKALSSIRDAEHVYLFGLGTSGSAAKDLYLKLNRSNKHAVYTSDAHAAIEFAVHMRSTDIAIAFSYSGCTREVIMAVQQAKKIGATVIAVTRNRPSPIYKLADIPLCVPDNEHLLRIGALASKYSTMLMVDLLFLGTIQSDMEDIGEDILATSTILRNLKERDIKSGKD